MKRGSVSLEVAALVAAGMVVIAVAQDSAGDVSELAARIEWLGSSHQYGSACIRIAGERVVIVDPADLREELCGVKADLILITHPHDDHCSPATVLRLQKRETEVVTVAECAEELAQMGIDATVVTPGDRVEAAGVSVEAVPAYNLVSEAHPKEREWVGFLLDVDGVRLYHSGDTSFTPEMAALEGVEIAILTLRKHYMMSGEEMIEAVSALGPKFLIPVHWLPEWEAAEIDTLRRKMPPDTRLLLLQPR